MKSLEVITEKKPIKKREGYLLDVLACILFLTGVIKIIFSGFPAVMDVWWIYAVISSVLACFLFLLFKTKERDWILLMGFALMGLLFFISKPFGTSGIAVLGNDFLTYLTGQTGKIYLDFFVESGYGEYLISAFFLFALVLVICWSISNARLFPCIMITIFCCTGCIIQLFTIDYAMVLLIAGQMMLWAGKEYGNKHIGKLIITALFMGTVLFLCFLPVVLMGGEEGRVLSFDKAINEFEHRMHERKYHSGIKGMPEGNLVDLGGFEKTKEPSLMIKTEIPQKFYLRGYIGEVYTGISWEGFDSSTYQEGEELFYWLHKSGFYGLTTIADVGQLMRGKKDTARMEIKNLGGCHQHGYLPYALADSTILRQDIIGDNRIEKNTDTLTVEYLPGSIPQWYETLLWMAQNQDIPEVKEYIKKEESYREFVYKNNLQLTNTVVGIFGTIFEEDHKKEKTLSEILDLIRETLEEKMTYDESVLTYNGRNDFVKFTLEQTKKGYSPHYATIATMMLRYMGVPARYAEGYFLSADEAAEYGANEEIFLTESHAHAWAEYYMEGIGWIPFEVTPGYIDEEEWEETGLVIADGKGQALGKGFAKSTLTYTPPKLPENKKDLPNLQSIFRFETKQMVFFLLILLFLVIVLFLLWVGKRYFRFKKFWKQLEAADHRTAVCELYGYGIMLKGRFAVSYGSMEEEIKQINEEARFSKKEINHSQRMLVEQFTQQMVQQCKEGRRLWQRIKEHYILWIY